MRKLILSLLAGASLFGAVISTAEADGLGIAVQAPFVPPVVVQVPLPKACVGSLCF
jgi:hypothetical protein